MGLFDKTKEKAKEISVRVMANMFLSRMEAQAKKSAPEFYGELLTNKIYLSDIKPSVMRATFENYEGDSKVSDEEKEKLSGLIPKDVERKDIDHVIVEMTFKTKEILININLKDGKNKNYKI